MLDRILFKSTIDPPPEEETEEEDLEIHPAPTLHPSKSSAFVNALRDLTHAPLTSSLRPRSAEGDHDSTVRARRGSAEDRHLRFSDVFARPRRSSASSDSEAETTSNRMVKGAMPRTKSLQPDQLRRQDSGGAASAGTDETDPSRKKAFWRRVTSFPALNTMATTRSSQSAPSSPKLPPTSAKSSPVASPALPSSPILATPATLRQPSYFSDIEPVSNHTSSSAPTTPTTPTRRTPRKMFTLSSNSPPSSPEESRAPPSTQPQAVNFVESPPAIDTPPLPRANSEQAVPTANRSRHFSPRSNSTSRRPVRSVSGSALPSRTTSAATSPRNSPSPIDSPSAASSPAAPPHVQTSTASLNTRFKSFLNSIPLPFLSAPTSTRSLSASTANSTKFTRKRNKHGPRCGEIQVIKYNSVSDLAKMGAVSDHRPVFLSCAIGVAEPSAPSEEKEDHP